MGAHITIEPVTVTLISWQIDHLGYTRCGDHINPERPGKVYVREERDVLRSVGTDDRETWTCDICHRHVTEWPRDQGVVRCVVEHPACRIY